MSEIAIVSALKANHGIEGAHLSYEGGGSLLQNNIHIGKYSFLSFKYF